MTHDHLPALRLDHATDTYSCDQAPDLHPLRALAEREELADAAARVTDEYGGHSPTMIR